MTQKLKIKKSDCNTIKSLKGNDFVAKNKTVLKSQKQNQELAMLDLEVASLKLELLVQTEIAKNNKDAYDEIYEKNIGYTVEIGELNQHITKLNGEIKRLLPFEKLHELDKLENKALCDKCNLQEQQVNKLAGVHETTLSCLTHETQQKDKANDRIVELEKVNELLRGMNEKLYKRLKGIPNWVRWIFKYIF